MAPRRVSFCLLAFVLGSVAAIGPEAAPSEVEVELELELEDDIDSAERTAEFGELLSEAQVPVTFRMGPSEGRSFNVRVPANGTSFPDVLVSLNFYDGAADANVYCSPGVATSDGRTPSAAYNIWKSDHPQGRDMVFISRYDPLYAGSVVETPRGNRLVQFVCTVESASSAAIGVFDVDLLYEDITLIDLEQAALTAIYDECCQDAASCQRWKRHIEQENTAYADFCHMQGNVCNNQGELIRLDLNQMDMRCGFPGTELRSLSSVQIIQMKGNRFVGRTIEVMEQIAKLQDVPVIEISGASFEGPLADQTDSDAAICRIAQGNSVKRLSLRSSNITDGNALEGRLPGLDFSDSELTVLILAENQFTGKIPAKWTTFRKIEHLDLSSNRLSGTIPIGFGNILYLKVIDLSGNALIGRFPPDILSGVTIWGIDLSHNALSGPIPKLFPSPTFFALNVGHNQLTGAFPHSLVEAAGLTELVMSHNQLTGPLPPALTSLEKLSLLDLGHNNFTGRIPPELGSLYYLRWLQLESNALTGPVPHLWVGMDNLIMLRLDDNALEGEIPAWLLHQEHRPVKPLVANFTKNKLTGFEHPWYGKERFPDRLTTLMAGQNQIEGTFPPILAKQFSLRTLDLSENKMSGPLPSDARDLTSVVWLNLSSNAFDGEIPRIWRKNIMMLNPEGSVMDLSHNDLTGAIPAFLFGQPHSQIPHRFYLTGNGLDYACPLSSEMSYIQDLECGDGQAQGSSNTGAASVALTGGNGTSDDEADSGSSSPNVIAPIAATVSAAVFAVLALFVAALIRAYKSSADDKVSNASSSSSPEDMENPVMRNNADSRHMLSGIDSSVRL